VVDDHAEVLELVGRALRRDQHDVSSAGSAAEALRELEARRPEIVVLSTPTPPTPWK
jgi:DNA-binding response OmpR family regulator